MSSSYPGSLDNFSTSHADGVNETIHASTVNDLADAVNKIESTLGANPVLTSNFSKVRKVTSSTTATSTDYQILADATSANVTVTLPAASSNSGLNLHIHKIDSSTHTVTITPAGTDTIEGASGNYLLRKQYGSIRLVSDGGSNWLRSDQVPVQSNVYYVDATNGNDAYSGTTPGLAKKTIGSALTAAGNYSTIYIANGLYSETVDLAGSKFGVRLLGNAAYGSTTLTGAVIQAPSDTASAFQVSTGSANNCEIANLTFMGHSNTYTGTVFDGENLTSSHVHDIAIFGVSGGAPGVNAVVGPGVYGGIGLHVNDAEQCLYEVVRINNCHIGFQMEGTHTNSRNEFREFFWSINYINFQDKYTSGDSSPGGNIFHSWKMENQFARAHAIAVLTSDGSNPADGDTLTVRDQTYRFKNTMALANDIQIGANIDATLLSMAHAVNGTGTAGTDYFAGTVAPTAMQAGYMHLPEYQAFYTFTVDAVDTTNHTLTFQISDTIGPDGNAYTASVTSAHLQFGKASGATSFERADWCVYQLFGITGIGLDLAENITVQGGNCWLIDSVHRLDSSKVQPVYTFIDSSCSPETNTHLKASYAHFHQFRALNTFTIEAGATGNTFYRPMATSGAGPGTTFVDNGTNTRWEHVQNGLAYRPTLTSAVQPQGSWSDVVPAKSGVWYPAPAGSRLSAGFAPVVGRVYFIPILADGIGGSIIADLKMHIVTGTTSAVAYAGVYTSGSDWLPATFYSRFTNSAVSASSSGVDIDFGAPFNANTPFQGRNNWLAVGFLTAAPSSVLGVASGEPPVPLVASATLSDLTGGGGQCFYQDGILSSVLPYFSNATALSVGAGSPAIFYKWS